MNEPIISFENYEKKYRMNNMSNILIVDDDKTFLLSLVEGLVSLDSDWNVFSAGNGHEALEVLRNHKIDLVVTDLKMPVMDGFELVAHITGHHKDIVIIIMTAFGTPDIEKTLLKYGTFQCLEKPLDLNVLEEKISAGLKARRDGYVKGISLTSFLQIIGMEGESCTLTIRSDGRIGYIYFDSGTLINAETGEIDGEEAALEIAVWENVEIEIEKKCRKTEKKIDMKLHHVLMEAHQRVDENRKMKDDRTKREAVLLLGEADSLDYPGNPNNYNTDNIGSTENSKQKENTTMNIKKLQEAIKVLKDDLGEGFLAADIYANADGQSIAGYNSNAKACALFNRITLQVSRSLKEAGFPSLGQYYILDLADKKKVVIIPLGDYQMGFLIDGTQTPLGLLLNIALPKVIDTFEEALTK